MTVAIKSRRNHAMASGTARSDTSPPFLYKFIEGVELMEDYGPGGYCVISIGELLNERYRVLYKLGHGSFSTAWLARDMSTQNLVAVKVGTASSNPREIDVLNDLSASSTDVPRSIENLGASMIPSILDSFTIQGPNGSHPSYVTTPARARLLNIHEERRRCVFEINRARTLALQIALAVAFIFMPLYETYGQPRLEPVIRFDGKKLAEGIPSHGILPVWLGKSVEGATPTKSRVVLSDFGESYAPSREARNESHMPLPTRPPEALFEPKSLSFPSDIWSLGCLLWSVLGQRPLFEIWIWDEDDLIADQVCTLGILPAEWWSQWEARNKWFTEDITPLNPDNVNYRSLEDRFDRYIQQPRYEEGMGHFEIGEKEALLTMLRAMITYRPKDRITAAEVLRSEWMTRWAIPAYQKEFNP
ncbi:MAG: hypothetical protein Q9163_004574 [Psora crenata]